MVEVWTASLHHLSFFASFCVHFLSSHLSISLGVGEWRQMAECAALANEVDCLHVGESSNTSNNTSNVSLLSINEAVFKTQTDQT